jgi:hypothetical protein
LAIATSSTLTRPESGDEIDALVRVALAEQRLFRFERPLLPDRREALSVVVREVVENTRDSPDERFPLDEHDPGRAFDIVHRIGISRAVPCAGPGRAVHRRAVQHHGLCLIKPRRVRNIVTGIERGRQPSAIILESLKNRSVAAAGDPPPGEQRRTAIESKEFPRRSN